MGNKVLVVILLVIVAASFSCRKSDPAQVITPTAPTDTPTHQTTLQFLMFDSTWRNDSAGTGANYGINRITSILIDSARHYVVYQADTYNLKAGEIATYECFTNLPYHTSQVTLYPDTITFFGTGKINWGNSQTDSVVGYKVH